MTTDMKIEYDCGFTLVIPTILDDDQTLLANAAFTDQMISMADATHDRDCEVCRA